VEIAKTVGIIGGMGPEATLDLFHKIIRSTPATRDQEHVHLIVDNNSQIPDRTEYILGRGPSPLPYLLQSLRLLEEDGAEAVCMACNTAHYFADRIRHSTRIPFLSIVESALAEIKASYGAARRIGLLATSGTVSGRVYHSLFEREGLAVSVPQPPFQRRIMELIYAVKAGAGEQATAALAQCIDHLLQEGAEVVVAACTEIPLLLPRLKPSLPVVDSTLALAREVVRFALESA